MRKNFLLFLLCSLACTILPAQEKIVLHSSGEILFESETSAIDSIKLRNSYSEFNMGTEKMNIPISMIDSITFNDNVPSSSGKEIVYIMYDNETVSVINPYKEQGVGIVNTQGHATVNATSGIENIEYHISGSTNNGSLSINSDKMITLALDNASISNPNSAAIYIAEDITGNIKLIGTNQLSDGNTGSQNATLMSNGALIFSGEGSLQISGYKKHAISSEKNITVENGSITVARSASDGFHSEGFAMNGGNLDISSSGDGIDAGANSVTIGNGTIKSTSSSNDTKGIKSDAEIAVDGGNITLTMSGAQSKGISSKKAVTFNGGDIMITVSGTAVLESSGSGYDPSYSTAVKSDETITVNDGSITIDCPGSNSGGKGLSADGDIIVNGGTVKITNAGNGSTYTNSSGAKDSYTSCCIKSDAGISLLGGNITCSSSGQGGKGISADGEITIGSRGGENSALILNVSTSGERFLVSGSGMSADYANPKAIKSEGNMTVNAGTIGITCSQSSEGGEGMESKAIMTINGGTIEIQTYDDCINASQHIAINGGTIHCTSSGNDGIDSNGTLTISGGFVISNGTRSPEEGFDCDQNTFTITGGTLIGTGGATSKPTNTTCTQRIVIYNNATPGNAICIKNSSNEIILLYQLPTYSSSSGGGQGGGPGGGSNSMVALLSTPQLANGSYTLYYGGTISGGTNKYGYNTGGTYTGGSSKSLSISSIVTTIN